MGTTLLLTLAQATATGGGSGSGGTYLAWAMALLGIAVAIFIVEMFVPSGGVLAILATVSLIGGVVLMFWEDTTFGLVALIVVLIALPFAIGLALKIMPSTPFIRAITLGDPEPAEDEDPDASAGPAGSHPQDHALVGREGRAVTDLRPVGMVMIDGRREECVAQSGVIAAGTPVRVVSVDGMQVKVKAV